MFEAMKAAFAKVKEELTGNGEHRASLVSALSAAHDVIESLEARVSALEAAAAPVAAVVDAITGAQQVETKAA